jgi:uncharacterized membrane protein
MQREEAAKRPRVRAGTLSGVDVALFSITTLILLLVLGLLVWSLGAQLTNYRRAIEAELASPKIDHAIILSYSRALDFAAVKTCSLFLGFVLVFLGAIYLLQNSAITYSLALEHENAGKVALATSSPGLVMITLGVLLIASVLYAKSQITYSAPPHLETPRHETTKEVVVDEAD